MVQEVVEVKGILLHLGHRLGGLFLIEVFLGLFDQGHHVPHPQDPGGHPVGVEDVQVVHLFPFTDKLNWLTGDGPDGHGGPTTGVPIQLGQDYPSDV